jgi:ubiquinone biosynthesis monooxygenase Coq7
MSPLDRILATADGALRTLTGANTAARPCPAPPAGAPAASLDEAQRRLSGALMRVNHVGEVCAQALYEAQAIGTQDPRLREKFLHAAAEELDHLAWTQRRIDELGGRTSLLNPLWHVGSFAIGLFAARLGDRVSLGFMAETERQVEAHLQGHLERLPEGDEASRQVVEAMKQDEARHAENADQLGGVELPWPARAAMRVAARVMTRTAHHI